MSNIKVISETSIQYKDKVWECVWRDEHNAIYSEQDGPWNSFVVLGDTNDTDLKKEISHQIDCPTGATFKERMKGLSNLMCVRDLLQYDHEYIQVSWEWEPEGILTNFGTSVMEFHCTNWNMDADTVIFDNGKCRVYESGVVIGPKSECPVTLSKCCMSFEKDGTSYGGNVYMTPDLYERIYNKFSYQLPGSPRCKVVKLYDYDKHHKAFMDWAKPSYLTHFYGEYILIDEERPIPFRTADNPDIKVVFYGYENGHNIVLDVQTLSAPTFDNDALRWAERNMPHEAYKAVLTACNGYVRVGEVIHNGIMSESDIWAIARKNGVYEALEDYEVKEEEEHGYCSFFSLKWKLKELTE